MLPVIIAGAGPCGLVAALTLEKSGIPYIIYERTTPAKLCSNAGSGIDMAPTAVKILDDKLGLAGKEWMKPYEYMHMSDMKGRKVTLYDLKTLKLKQVAEGRSFGFANRSDLQHTLLNALNLKDNCGNIKDDDGRLFCSTSILGYQNIDGKNADEDGGFVRVELSDGSTVDASALLACDGIHSAVRKHMYKDANDPLNYCGQECWWGKTTVEAESDLDRELRRIVASEESLENGNVSLLAIGTRKMPGAFFSCEVAPNVHAWAYIVERKTPPPANATNDLTRRGGSVLTEEEKRREIDEAVADRSEIVRLIAGKTPAGDITRAGFFDRKNLDLGYVDGRVALLGDAAHPQSPMMGQGANMAIVDGYVAATRLSIAMKGDGESSGGSVEQALSDYDCKARRKNNNLVIKKARKYGRWTVSENRFACWMTKKVFKHMPASMMVSELVSGDKSNKQFVNSMRKDLQLEI